MEKLKVMFISAANSIHTARWVNALSEFCEIHLIYCKNHRPNIDVIDSKVISYELPIKAPLGYYLNAGVLRKLYNKIQPNIVNVHYASGYGTLARISRVKPTILSVWGSDVYDFPNKSKQNKKILQKNIMYAEHIASTSNVMAKEVKKQVPMLNQPIYITPFGVDTEKFKKVDIKRTDSEFRIGNIKTLEKLYGIDYLILGVDKLIQNLKDRKEITLANSIKVFIYGDGSQKQKLEELIKEKHLEKQIFLLGKIPNEQVSDKINQLDLFCVTSNCESFGVSILEAMACEVPVVSTDAEGFCEIMEDNITGYIVERKNIQQIAETIEKMIMDKEKRKIMGQNGRKRVLINYNWKENVQKMLDIYKECKQDSGGNCKG